MDNDDTEYEPGPREFKYYCDPPCPCGFNKMANLVKHKEGNRCYHKRPFVCPDCHKRFRDEDLAGHKEHGNCNKKKIPPAL